MKKLMPMEPIPLIQRTDQLSYIDARWDWQNIHRGFADTNGRLPTDSVPFNRHQATAQQILGKEWDENRQTSRSTPKWSQDEKYNIDSLDTINSGDLRAFIIDTIDGDVYCPYRSPGLHAVPKEFTGAEHLVVNDYQWSERKDNKLFLRNGEIIQERQLLPIQRWEAQITMVRTKDGYHFKGVCNDKYEYYHSRDFVTPTVCENSNDKWNKEIIDECSRRLFEHMHKPSEHEEVWLCENDIIIEEKKVYEDRVVFKVAFHFIDIAQPSAKAIRLWKIGQRKHYAMERIKKNYRKGNWVVHRQRPPEVRTPAEVKALKTLRDHITEREYRRYLTNGFIMVKGASGLYYQIFASQKNIQVWENNEKAYSICIHTDRSCPPTDHVINCKLLITFDEKEVWRGGNVHGKISMPSSDNLVEENWHLIVGVENEQILCG